MYKQHANILIYGLLLSTFATITSVAEEIEPDSHPRRAESAAPKMQDTVNKAIMEQTAEKRRKLQDDAIAAVNETKHALKALEEKKSEEALEALALVTGKLELIVARDPGLSLAPLDVQVVIRDVFATPKAIEEAIAQAKDLLDEGEIQKARPIIANLASEIAIQIRHIPLATYPEAIKKVAPLIDEDRIEEAKTALQLALNTLVISADEVIPLPKLRAEELLKRAEELAEKKDRSEGENTELKQLLSDAREQLKMARLLGYGEEESYDALYEQLGNIEKKTAGGKSEEGLFDRVKEQISRLL